MHAEIVALRLIHILSGIFWMGSGLFTTFFLIPALAGSPGVMGQVMSGLQRKRLFFILPTVAIITILSGFRLLSINSASFGPGYFATGTGRTFAISSVAAIIAFLLSVIVSRPSAVRAGAIAATLASSPGGAERDRLVTELARVQRRAAVSTALTLGFGIVAASGMAIARYV